MPVLELNTCLLTTGYRKEEVGIAKHIQGSKLNPICNLLKMFVAKSQDKTQFHMVKGIINAFDHMELGFVINLIFGGNRAVTWPSIIATRNVSFVTTLNTR